MSAKRQDVVTLYRCGPTIEQVIRSRRGSPRSYWRWRRIAPNGELVGASTESYSRKKDCLNNARRCQTPCPIRSGK